MAKITVREAEAADAAAIEALYRQLVSNPAVSVLPKRITDVAKDAGTALLVAEISGVVVGTVLVSFCLDVMFRNQPFGVVENIVVDATRRAIGVGAALMHEVEHRYQTAGCSKIMLLSAAERADAHRFFECAGFVGSSKKGFVKYRRQFGNTA